MKVSARFISLCIVYFFTGGFIHSVNVDSLRKAVSVSAPDTHRVILLIRLVPLEFVSSRDNAKKYLEEIQSLSTKLNYTEGKVAYLSLKADISAEENDEDGALRLYLEASKLCDTINYPTTCFSVFNDVGTSYIKKGDYKNSEIYFHKAMRAAVTSKDPGNIANAYVNLGLLYNREGNSKHALDMYYEALKLFEENRNDKGLSRTYNNIGIVYFGQEKYKDAADYFKRSLSHFIKFGDSTTLEYAGRIANIAEMYYQQKDYAQALPVSLKAFAIRKKIGNAFYLSNSYLQLGSINGGLKKYDVEIKYLDSCLALAQKLNNDYLMASAEGNLSDTYFNQKKYEKALTYALEAEHLAVKLNDPYILKHAYSVIYETYNALNKNTEAFSYLKKFILLKDSIVNSENKEQLARKELTFEFDKKEATQKIEQEKKDALNHAQLKQQRIITYSIVAVLLLALVVAFISYRSYKEKQKANVALEYKNREIAEKNKEITDSIHYAQRIQSALMASDQLLNENLREYFVLYQPKDIVSGDFYWAASFTDSKTKIFSLATCDCTGHGVPGAFMSLLNITFLKEVILQKNVHSTDQAFNEVRNEIISALNPGGKETGAKDGMDAVLCHFDLQNLKMDFTCANNPLLLIRNNQITKFGPDKFPVGMSHGQMRPFSKNSIELQKGDIIYTFTDGYGDQFGGEKGKKFKYKNLEALLLSIHAQPMPDQKAIVEKRINDWRGSLEQVDDILVIGIKI